MKIFSKIQNHEGLHNYEEILAVSDGIMINRVDLGMEIAPEKVFVAQKWMLERANVHAKQIINSTQMMSSMCKQMKPTRPEASDVANAVLDGNDCLMLSGETAEGDNPEDALKMMATICVNAEKTVDYKKSYYDVLHATPKPVPTAEAIASACCRASLEQGDLCLIIVLAETAKLPGLISKYKPEILIYSLSTSDKVVR